MLLAGSTVSAGEVERLLRFTICPEGRVATRLGSPSSELSGAFLDFVVT